MATKMKRSLEYQNEIETKRIKVETRSILDFSDCVLLQILSHLKPYDLYCLSKTCQRFKYLISERKLWKKVDLLDHPMCSRKFKFFFDNVNNSTDTILVCGISKKEKTLTFSQFIKMNKICDNLTILAIENQYINSDEIVLKDFPESLKELSLRGTHIYGRQPFLQNAHLKLQKLHTLILADCKWFHEHSLMALSKLRSLENLSLYKCANLNDSVAYMSITAKFGFRKLLRIDARCTAIGDQFLKCFHCIKTLREIYLEAPVRPKQRMPRRQVLDQLQRLAGSPLVAGAVVFNRSQLFKMRRDRLKISKKIKKPQVGVSQSPRDATFNCLENCDNCSMDTCSFIPTQTSDQSEPPNPPPKPRFKPCGHLENPDVALDFEFPFYSPNSTFYEVRLLNFPESPRNPQEAVNHGDDVRRNLQEAMNHELEARRNPQAAENPGDDVHRNPQEAVNHGDDVQENRDRSASSAIDLSQGANSASTSSQDVEGAEGTSRSSSPTEMLYCDDVSDTEDEEDLEDDVATCRASSVSAALLELEMLHADVTDQGLLWFMGAAPSGSNHEGQPSVLFHPPYRRHCTCGGAASNTSRPDDDAGPSGLPTPNPPPQPPATRSPRRVRFCPASPCPSSDSSDSEAEAAPPLRPRRDAEVVYGVIGRDELRAGRDLRVIIERLDPGVHIVYDHAGAGAGVGRRLDFNTTTQLKVFVARGYKLITNQALRSLVDLRLELLDVTGTSVNATGVRDFLMVNPDCRVIHESTACRCG